MQPARRPLGDEERLDWLCLARSEGVGPVAFRQLLDRFGTAAAALAALPELARRAGRTRPLQLWPRGAAARELDALARLGGRLLALAEPDYPEPLAAIEDAPPLLGLLGRAELLQRPAIAVVGARNASANGRRIAEDLAAELGRRGFVIASGLARGIDGAAHQGALASGTVAVVAGGLDVVYPPEHAGLQRAVAEQGAVVAEMPPGTQPQARHFPRRNRIISGLSLGIVVVEAALRSGSLTTARMAGEQGRQVTAVPGSPLDPRARGCNQLIRSGAVLVESADDVIEALEGMTGDHVQDRRAPAAAAREPLPAVPEIGAAGLDSARHAVLARLSPSPVAVDELLRQCHLSAATVSAVLLDLELAGRLERHPGNRVSLLAGNA
ncbi:MAG: DNA-processing protein DprA [Dongiaceae bacterium]